MSRRVIKNHDQGTCRKRAYSFATDDGGHLFCYFGCTFDQPPNRLDLLVHLTYKHRDDTGLLNKLGLSWNLISRQCDHLEQ